jgi:hypothetical protein
MAEGPYVPPVWAKATVYFLRAGDRWMVDLWYQRSDIASVMKEPIASGPVGLPLDGLQMLNLTEQVGNLIDVAITQVIEPF